MTRWRSIILTLFLLTCWLAASASQVQAALRVDGTTHTGTLTGDETWTPAGNPHYVDGSITIPAGVTLTLQPGVIVGSYNNYYTDQTGRIFVEGVLNAIGTLDNKIIFTSKDDSAPMQWDGLNVSGGTATLAYAEVRYGGGGGGCRHSYYSPMCVEHAGTLSIDHVDFHHNSPLDSNILSGVVTAFSASDAEQIHLSLTDSSFEDNGVSNLAAGYYPVSLNGPGIQLTLAGNTFANNQVNRILLQNNPMKTQVDLTLPAQTGLDAYVIGGDWTVPTSQTLTLSPGVTLLASHGSWGRGLAMVVEGKLVAQGSADQKITLNAIDPAYGWSGLVISGTTGLAQMSNTQILHGGTPGLVNVYQSNLVVKDGARLELSDSRVANLVTAAANYRDGALMLVNGTAVLTDNTIADNLPAGASAGLYAMRVSGPQSRLEMVNNTFSGNFVNAVLLGSDGLAATINTLRPQTGLLGYDFGTPYADYTYIQQPTGQLTLEAGTHLRGVTGPWGKGIYFEVRGSLNAMGTAEAPVVFDSSIVNAPASWGGIYINGGTAELYQTRIVNGGRGNDYPTPGPFPSLWVAAGGRLSLFDSTIADNRTSGQPDLGVLVDNASASLVRSTFSGLGNPGEADYPLKVSGTDSRLTLRDNTFTGNSSDRAQLASNALTGADFTLIPQDGLSGYELVNTLTVPDGVTMTVSPGVSLYGRSGAGLVVKGRLTAERNSGLPILFTSLSDSSANQWSGVIFDGSSASGSLEDVTLRYGGSILAGGSSYPQGGLVFYNLASDAVQVRRCAISYGYKAGWQIFNSSTLLPTTLDGNRISASSSGPGLRLSGTSQVVLANTAILDNDSGGANLDASGTQLTLLHPTLARNKVYGLRAATGASANLNNAIFARNAVALRAETGGAVTSDTALWDANTVDTAGPGTINILNLINGAAAFDPADGYHLTQYSEATGKGKAAIQADDVDGSIRPQPAGSLPDLGADEFNQATALTLTAEKLALPPVWINRPDASSNPSGVLLQQYWIRFHYGNEGGSVAPLNVSGQDTLPADLAFQGEQHSPQMTFIHNGQQLNWQTTQPLAPQGTVDIQIDTQASNPQAGSVFTNQAVVTAGTTPFNLSASTSVPVFTPLVTWPANGELCPVPDHALSVEGSAQPGATIEIYEGATFKGQSVVDAKGLFKVSYSGSQAGLSALPLRARACASGTCSGFTQINLAMPISFWDPQRSWWEGDPIVGPMAGKHVTFKFRDQDGLASSTSWIIPGVYGFSDTTLHLYACQDAATSKMPTQIWITADAHVYIPIAVDGPMYTYKIGNAHRVDMQATYREDPPPDPPDPNDPPPPPPPGYPPEPEKIRDREVWIDPDGYVFNSTLGFDPLNPTQHVIPGARVTCMVLLPGWGGWVPWPAHLYGGQINPQVVGSNGYFAFFTPPGQYYIQVDGPSGYQSYRSPVVTVVNEIVHVNIPLTPAISGSSPIYTLQSSRAGFSQVELTIPVEAWVRWEIIQSMREDPASLLADIANPLLRLVSSPDPFASDSGWDSGRIYPSQVYTHQFTRPGTYTYTDSNGHTAIIHVVTSTVYIPLIRR
jgi:Right handed beta helix region